MSDHPEREVESSAPTSEDLLTTVVSITEEASGATEGNRARIVRTLRHAVAYGIGYSASTVIGILLVPFYLRVLSPAEYGMLALLTATLGVTSELFSMGLSSALFRSYFDYDTDEARRDVVTTALLLVAAAAAVLLIAGITAAGRLSDLLFDTTAFANHLRIVFLVSALRLFRSIPFATYRARHRSKEWAVLNVAFSLLKVGLVGVLVFGLDQGIIGILIAELVAEALLCAYLFARSFADVTGRFVRGEARRMLAYGIPLGLMSIVGVVTSTADKYMLQAFVGPEGVGIYDLGQKFGLMIMFFLVTPFKLVWQPMSLELLGKPGATPYYGTSLQGLVYLLSVALVTVSVFVSDVLRLFAPPSYWGAATIVFPLCLVTVIHGLLIFGSFGLAVARRSDLLAAVNVAGAVVNIGLNLVLIRRWGIEGAAVASVCSWSLILLLDGRLSSRHVDIPAAWSRLGTVAAAILVVVITARVLDAAQEPVALSIALKSLLIVLFAGVAALTIFGRERSHAMLRLRAFLSEGAVAPPAADA